jgi:hypothetical protein
MNVQCDCHFAILISSHFAIDHVDQNGISHRRHDYVVRIFDLLIALISSRKLPNATKMHLRGILHTQVMKV